MNNAEIIKGIERTIEGLNTIKSALLEADADIEVKETKTATTKSTTKKEESAVEEKKEVAGSVYSEEELRGMKYNEFKKYASSLGVKCTGTRDEIMERILALDSDTNTEDKEEVEEPNTTADEPKSGKSKGGKKLGKKKDAEPEEDEFDKQAREVAEETDLEDIIEALADVDIKATKKNAISKLADALRKGLIELDGEEEDDGEAEETTESDSVEEDIEADSYFPEYDPDGLNDPEEMTDERATAIAEKMDDILTSYADGTLTDEDIQSYVEDNATQDEIDLLGDEPEDLEILKMYMELVKRTIDDEGDEHEQGEPYEVGDNNLCCGHVLKYVKKTKNYVCEHCGEEYEAE